VVNNTQRTKVLITVKTYPVPSKKYQEVVCTAGITEAGEWVRLYPIEYRYLPLSSQYKKYQWIEVTLQARGAGNDKRKESRKPLLEDITLLGEPLSTDNAWAQRRQLIDKLPHLTLNQYQDLYNQDGTSLGVVRPSRIIDLKIEKSEEVWDESQAGILNQQRLFGESVKDLAKIPYKFRYVFECEDSHKPHTAMCEDWELGALYLNELKRLKGNSQKAAESVRHKFFDDLCAPDKDTRFFMGTIFPFNTWVVLGIFYPPKTTSNQLSLF
jgi:hypothetical protein